MVSSASRLASERTKIGIRVALGARTGAVLAMVMRQGMIVAAAGVAGGLAASIALTRYLTTMLFGVSAADPATTPVWPP